MVPMGNHNEPTTVPTPTSMPRPDAVTTSLSPATELHSMVGLPIATQGRSMMLHHRGAQTYDSNQPCRVDDRSSPGMPSPHPSPWDTERAADSQYPSNATGIMDNFPLSAAFLGKIGFTTVELYGKLQHVHQVIQQSWHNKIHNTFGPQESILKSTAFSTKLLLNQFDAPSVVCWYERLTDTCKAYRISLVPFDTIQFTHWHKGLCIPGLGTD
jgi:hypothetical protein